MQERGPVALLGLHVDGLEAVHRVHQRRQVELREVGGGEAAVAVGRPLHRRAHAVAVAEEDVVAHPDLVAVVEDRAARHREEHGVEQLGHVLVVVEQREQPAGDADVAPHPGIGRVLRVHVVPLLVGDHLQGQLVVVAQEDAPLAAVGDRRGLGEDLGDRLALLPPHRHEHARHEREVEAHVALVAVGAEVVDDVGRPLVGLGQQHPTRGTPSSTIFRTRRRYSWVSGRFSPLVPSRSNRYGTASRRNPSRPRSSQNRTTSSIASATSGLS